MPTRKGKWQPFDGLEGYRKALRQSEQAHNKNQCPRLCEDRIEELDYLLQKAFHEKHEICLTYFRDGYYFEVEGKLQALDVANNIVIIDEQKIKLFSIFKIKEKREK